MSEQCGGCTWGKSRGIDSGRRVALTVERAARVGMPLHWVPLRLCGCRVSSAIVDGDEESELVRVRGVASPSGKNMSLDHTILWYENRYI
jgi:hypothetical protein